ncbi:PKD domain-containing protein [Nocardioides coralli]|uniref:PKD domain-containing protein n=1 Tax=Nocardioides coralli TaxID=2872154 RepID=UPI001CA40FAD|nr:PKD domain-containing protein [Nocardioides coralli]QZY29140.1 immune inhibitor A [Nocardioides coralli]
MPLRPRATLSIAVATALATSLLLPATQSASAEPPKEVQPAAAAVVSEDTVGGLLVENSFVSSVGWVKPGDTYPSRILLTNSSDADVSGVEVTVAAPEGATFTDAGGGATVSPDGTTVTWSPGSVAATSTRTLVLESRAATTDALPTIVWRDISSTATVSVGADTTEVTSHGPKVIPPGEEFDTARYGDRPFPVVPVAYTDRDYQDSHERSLDTVINDPAFEGSTFNLFQEMSLGQLYPEGTVPSEGIADADFDYGPGFDFSKAQAGQTCKGVTFADTPTEEQGTPAYPDRIRDGVYQLPGTTEYYGSDANGTALTGAVAGVGALQAIDSGCGPTGKLVRDAAAIADPEIDYSDYDTDKDGVVDFFMAVFAGCGGNGASQLTVAACEYPDASYDNVWPHSSSLEFYYSDPETGLPGFTTDDQLKDLEGRPLWYEDQTRSAMTTTDTGDALKVYVRVGPYNVNPETAIDRASVISHEYGHSLGLPDFYSTGNRDTYGDWSLMATDKSHNIDAYGRQELGWVVPEVLDSSRTEAGITDSKEDTDTITWQQPDGTPYTLTEGEAGVVRVQNSQMYVAKLPGRVLLDPAKFDSGDGATPVHTWWSRSGNDYGCAKDLGKGHNIDVNLRGPAFDDLPAGTELSLDLKSMWDIEWDYDYGFVLTSTDGGQSFGSNESEKGYTTPASQNPNQNACQAHYGNGLTGTSQSYADGTQDVDRVLGNYPEMIYKADSYDISELVGSEQPVLRFSYATDPGLSRPGWFIDDVTVTATLPGGETREIYTTDFESSGDPDDPRIFNGGCKPHTPGSSCTQGWQYVAAGAEGPSDHAYYLEMRDRSGFDLDGNGQNDRAPIGFESGFYNSYTDEAHGYGNAGTDDPPAQSPLDSSPQPGNSSPNLNDAAWRPGDTPFSDSGEGHTDNYEDPQSQDDNWHFRHDCLTYDVTAMSGEALGPDSADGDLTGTVDFTLGAGCGEFDYGYGEEVVAPPAGETTPPRAAVTITGGEIWTGRKVRLDATRSSDDTSASEDLTYEWDLDNDGRTDATGPQVTKRFGQPGRRKIVLTVTDEAGNSDTLGRTLQVNKLVHARADQVRKQGQWRQRSDRSASKGAYLTNRPGGARDVLTWRFSGPRALLVHGDSDRGGRGTVYVDGTKVGTVSFRGEDRRIAFAQARRFRGLGGGKHTLRLVLTGGKGFVTGLVRYR